MKQREKTVLQNPSTLACIYLHPTYNILLSDMEKTIAVEHISSLWQRLQSIRDSQISHIHDEDQIALPDSESDCNDINELVNWKKNSSMPIPPDSNSALAHSLHRYKNLVLNTTISNVDPMQFWKERKDKNRELHSIACVIFAAAPTQVSVERAFSGLAFILNPQRTNLGDKNIDNIMIIRQNRDLFQVCSLKQVVTSESDQSN